MKLKEWKKEITITRCVLAGTNSSECDKVEGCYCCKWHQSRKYVTERRRE
jgi:hypothetical protein